MDVQNLQPVHEPFQMAQVSIRSRSVIPRSHQPNELAHPAWPGVPALGPSTSLLNAHSHCNPPVKLQHLKGNPASSFQRRKESAYSEGPRAQPFYKGRPSQSRLCSSSIATAPTTVTSQLGAKLARGLASRPALAFHPICFVIWAS